MNDNRIGIAIAQELARRGMTDRAASDLLDVSQPTVTRWRMGTTAPQIKHATRLAAFLDIPLAKVERMIEQARRRQPPAPKPKGPETFGMLMRAREAELGITAVEALSVTGIDKSRYYRLRSDNATPNLADIPDLAHRLKVPEERAVLAAYRTELARVGRALQEQRREPARA